MAACWRALGRWLVDPWPLWLAIAGILAAWIAAYLPASTLENQARYAGLILQVLGLATVAYGLSQMRGLFGRPTFVKRAVEWLARFPLMRKPKTLTVKVAVAATAVAGARLKVRKGAPQDASLERRVGVLEDNFAALDGEVDQLRSDLGKTEREQTKRTDADRLEREKADAELGRKIEEVAVGGLHLEAIGLAWLFVGVLLGTVPDEIARLLMWLGDL